MSFIETFFFCCVLFLSVLYQRFNCVTMVSARCLVSKPHCVGISYFYALTEFLCCCCVAVEGAVEGRRHPSEDPLLGSGEGINSLHVVIQ